MGHSWNRKQGQPRERKSLLGSKKIAPARARLVPDNSPLEIQITCMECGEPMVFHPRAGCSNAEDRK